MHTDTGALLELIVTELIVHGIRKMCNYATKTKFCVIINHSVIEEYP